VRGSRSPRPIFQARQYAIDMEYQLHNGSALRGLCALRTAAAQHEPVVSSYFHPKVRFQGPATDGHKYEKLKNGQGARRSIGRSTAVGWPPCSHHFVAAIGPPGGSGGTTSFDPRNEFQLAATAPTQQLSPGRQRDHTPDAFVGPKLQGQLEKASHVCTVDRLGSSLPAPALFWTAGQGARDFGTGADHHGRDPPAQAPFYPLSEASIARGAA